MTRPVSHFGRAMASGCGGHEAGQRGAFDGPEKARGVPAVSEAAKKDGEGLLQVSVCGLFGI